MSKIQLSSDIELINIDNVISFIFKFKSKNNPFYGKTLCFDEVRYLRTFYSSFSRLLNVLGDNYLFEEYYSFSLDYNIYKIEDHNISQIIIKDINNKISINVLEKINNTFLKG